MSEASRIPFLDLISPHAGLKAELCEVFNAALETAGFIGGPVVEGFEEDFARFCGSRLCVAVGSGTDALRFAIIACGIGPGDLVITAPNTFMATAEAISQAGARPVFVDVNECTMNLDAAKIREYIELRCEIDPGTGRLIDRATGGRVAAIVPVHLYGQPADMDAIRSIGDAYGLAVVEDACQAHGAEYFSRSQGRWLRAGSMGIAAAFSFYPGKNLGACGEAGAVTTDDPQIAERIRMLRDHGQSRKYHHDLIGYNGRMDAIQAGILRVKLRYLAEWNERRREAARIYGELFAPAAGLLRAPVEPDWARSAYHLYVVRARDRDELHGWLESANIGAAIHYPAPIHLQEAYAWLGYHAGDFPAAESAAAEILSLPMYPGLEREQQVRVAERIVEFLARGVGAAAQAGAN